MVEFLKDRILLFGLVIAGDFISLAALIKANEIRQDAITIAIAVSLLPSLVISLLVRYLLLRRVSTRKFLLGAIFIALALWGAFIFYYLRFSEVNNMYGKVPYPATQSRVDSMIVGGCRYTFEAQAEVDDYIARKRTLTPAQLFEDFNYDLSQVWSEPDRDCARSAILNVFAIMLAFLIAGLTLTCEIAIAKINNQSRKKTTRQKTVSG